FYQLGTGNITSKDELENKINLASGGKLRTYLTLLKKYNILANKGYKLTDLGKILYEYDMDINTEASLWLLHYLITSNDDNLVYNELFGTYFRNNDFLELEKVKYIFEKYNFPEATMKSHLRKEVRSELKLYTRERFSRLFILEEEELLKQNIKYYLNRNMLRDEKIFMILLYYYRFKFHKNESSIQIKTISNGVNSPGIFCCLDEYLVRELLEKLHLENKISIESRAGLDQIRFLDDRTYLDILKEVLL
ncbi:MAG: DUF4007 family protein, partial [Cetobacterium sp.]